MDKYKELLHILLMQENLEDVPNVEYIEETMEIYETVTAFKAKKVLDSYGKDKWWLSKNVETRAYGQLQENEMFIIEFDDVKKGVELILGEEVECADMATCRPKVLERSFKKLVQVNNEMQIGDNFISYDESENER